MPSNDNGFFYFNSSNLGAAQNELNFQGYDYTAVSRKFLLGMALKSANNEYSNGPFFFHVSI